jgi:hypothetical protein
MIFAFVNSYSILLSYLPYFLCPFAVYYLRYAVRSFFTMSRTSLSDGKRAGQKVQRKIAVAVQNVKPLYFLSRSFEFRGKYCQQTFLLI